MNNENCDETKKWEDKNKREKFLCCLKQLIEVLENDYYWEVEKTKKEIIKLFDEQKKEKNRMFKKLEDDISFLEIERDRIRMLSETKTNNKEGIKIAEKFLKEIEEEIKKKREKREKIKDLKEDILSIQISAEKQIERLKQEIFFIQGSAEMRLKELKEELKSLLKRENNE